jgi:hypothetical protein
LARVLMAMLCGLRIDRHAAHGVDRAVAGGAVTVTVSVMLVDVRHCASA